MKSKISLMIVIIFFLNLGIFCNLVRAQDYITLDGGCTYGFNTPTPENNLEGESSSSNYYIVKQTSPIYDPMTFGDSDHDGNLEVYFTWQPYIKVWEFDKYLNYVESELPYYGIPWDIGDIDGNGLNDLIVQSGEPGGPCSGNGYLRIYEAPNLYSFPSVL